jgi:fucose permease
LISFGLHDFVIVLAQARHIVFRHAGIGVFNTSLFGTLLGGLFSLGCGLVALGSAGLAFFSSAIDRLS